MARKLMVAAVAVALWVVVPAVAQAAPVTLCVPSGPDAAVTTLKADDSCPAGKTKTAMASDSDLTAAKNRIATLETLLAGVTRSSSDGVTTLRFSGMNVQVVSGSGHTDGAVNGEGNLIVGYDEARSGAKRTGSHNLVLGQGQSFSSYGSVLAGERNASSAHGALMGGVDNTAVASDASVTGGQQNRASEIASSITGGTYNKATARWASVSGGACGLAGPGTHFLADACGYAGADGTFASVTGGLRNVATGIGSVGSGGAYNSASGDGSAMSGGQQSEATASWASVSGGFGNHATGEDASILGGEFITKDSLFETYPAGP